MAQLHTFGTVLRQLRARVSGLTQARVAELAGYDPAVITRMARGRQDLTGPQTRTRVLRVIQALDHAGALWGLEDANALLAAANLSPLLEASDREAALIARICRHSDVHTQTRSGSARGEAPAYVRQLLHEYAHSWDQATLAAERVMALAAAGELAMRYGQPTLGMRLLARAALDEDTVLATECVFHAPFIQHMRDARAHLARMDYANAWAAGQLLTLAEARAWLAVLPSLVGT